MQTKGLALDLGSGLTLKRFTLTYSDLTTAGLTQTIALFTLAKGGIVLGVRIKHSTAFSGTGWTACTVSVGSSSNGATGYASAFDIFQAVADAARQLSQVFKDGPNAAEAVNAYFTSVGGNLSVGTAGSVDIDVLYANPTTPGI